MHRSALSLEDDENQRWLLTGGMGSGIVGASVNKEDDMYSKTRFNCAKSDLVSAYLYPAADSTKQVEHTFIRALLGIAAKQGRVTQDDVQRAIEASGIFDLSPEIADQMLRTLNAIGEYYFGALSRHQAAELRQLRKLCILAAATGDADAWAQIAELI